jgi:hypothetical protein
LTLTSPHSHRCDDPNYVSASKDVQSTSQSPNAAHSATRVATSTNFAPPTDRFSILAFPLLSLITQAPSSKSCPPGQLDSDCLTFAAQAVSTSPASGGWHLPLLRLLHPSNAYNLPLILPATYLLSTRPFLQGVLKSNNDLTGMYFHLWT